MRLRRRPLPIRSRFRKRRLPTSSPAKAPGSGRTTNDWLATSKPCGTGRVDQDPGGSDHEREAGSSQAGRSLLRGWAKSFLCRPAQGRGDSVPQGDPAPRDDARYHYLLGLTLWMSNDSKRRIGVREGSRPGGGIAAFWPGRASAVLERIQGPARQAVNAYRP